MGEWRTCGFFGGRRQTTQFKLVDAGLNASFFPLVGRTTQICWDWNDGDSRRMATNRWLV